MFLWSHRQVVYFFVLLIFFIALLARPDWARAVGPWPDRVLLALVVFTMYLVVRP